jgi:ribose transport system permease protein
VRTTAVTGSAPRGLRLGPDDKPVVYAAGFVLLILLVGTGYTLFTQGSAPLLQPQYLLQQLQVGSFLGVVAAGLMLVILLGHIDLSVPWTLTAAAMMATAIGGPWAIPAGIGVGFLVGIVNGLGVAYLRVPSMIFTLGMNAVMRGLLVARIGGVIPVALLVWLAASAAVVVILTRTTLGRAIYAIGNRERAAYLSGINTSRVILIAFALSGAAAGLAGVLLAGYSTKAYQGMGDAYLLPAIAAVVIGGTNILGGRGRYLGTLVGVILIVLLNSVLSIMQMPEAGRQIIYGIVIIAMLLVYGRGGRLTG